MTELKRKSGVLLHISSLPGPYGIGSLGKSAYSFVDFLSDTGQSFWQVLPLCPTSFGDSPYQSPCVFAGNEYFIDLDFLCKDGFLKKSDLYGISQSKNEREVDYQALYELRKKVLFRAWQNFRQNPPPDFVAFCDENAFWLDDYALFKAVKEHFKGESFLYWDEDIKKREHTALKRYIELCDEKIRYDKAMQYLFSRQWVALKKYANEKGVAIIGDMPIYAALDSSDVWAHSKLFSLDGDMTPIEVAGCPPDSFSQNGQLWGNPVYNWENMKKENYNWWIKRFELSFKMFDALRLDHFRGFEAYYCVKFGAKTAREGLWKKGVGYELFDCMKKRLGEHTVIAENLGFLTAGVDRLLEKCGFYSMKVLQLMFGFDIRENLNNIYEIDEHTAVYTGTHDNNTLIGWAEDGACEDAVYAMKTLGAKNSLELAEKMLQAAMKSRAEICILTMQDLLGLDGKSRMNTPSTLGNNWKWRMTADEIDGKVKEKLLKLTEESGRCGL